MTTGALFWLILFAIAGTVFFGIALVVSIRGVKDLRDLLSTSERRGNET
jgi:hypothetical protein